MWHEFVPVEIWTIVKWAGIFVSFFTALYYFILHVIKLFLSDEVEKRLERRR